MKTDNLLKILKCSLKISPLVSDIEQMDHNLCKKLSLSELFALLIGLATIGITVWLYQKWNIGMIDYIYFINSAGGILDHFFMGFWIMPIFNFLKLLPIPTGYFFWGILNLLGIWFAARVFRGDATFPLLVYQLIYMLFYGQVTGLIVGGFGLAWYGLVHKKWDLAGFGFLVAGAKPQTGLMAGGLLWLLFPLPWREKFRILLVPILGVVLSLIIYPNWPMMILNEWRQIQPNDFGSITLWRWIGPIGLFLVLPPIFVKNLSWHKRFIALVSACTLALPYFQQADLLILFVLPISAFPLMGNLGFLFPKLQYDALKLLAIVPMTIYIVILLSAFFPLKKGKRRQSEIIP